MLNFHRLARPFHTFAAASVLLLGANSRADGTDDITDHAGDRARRSAEISDSNSAQTLSKWIDALAAAESGGRAWIVHRDRDGRDYYGCLQFRERTFRFFVRKFNIAPNVEPDAVMNLIYDCALQKRVASRMIRENPENWKHWRKTVERIGLPPGAAGAVDSAADDVERPAK
jgi:hypothetical protein